jgi:hypothetical protein
MQSEPWRPRVISLVTVLAVQIFGALTWGAFLGFSSDIGTDRQLHAALAFGAATWLPATVLIVWLWKSGRMSFWVPFAWWLPSFLIMIAVVYGWNDDPAQSPASIPPVGATATFGESEDCLLRYGNEFERVRLDHAKVASCFPTQTAAKKKALIACFNTYERNHPGHPEWPADNMKRCTWDGLIEEP